MAHPYFSRTTIFCRDVERSLALYRDILGFAVIDDKTISGPAAGGLLGLESCTLRMVFLADDGGADPKIGLFEISDAEVPELAAPPRGIAHGQVATVVATDDFDGVAQALNDADVTFLTPPLSYVKKIASPRSPAGTYREMIFQDPDGVLVSVMQIIPLSEGETA